MKYSETKDPWYTKKTWAEISQRAILNNLEVIRRAIGDPKVFLAPVVKADAYGHCAELVVPVLEEAGVNHLCVATVDEAIMLRQGGVRSDILIFGTTKSEHVPYLKRYRLTQSLVTEHEIASFAAASQQCGGPPLKIHIKLDTGMTRLGLKADERHQKKTAETMLWASREPHLQVEGVYSHLASADTDPEYSHLQLKRFNDTVQKAEQQGFPRVIRHLASSSAIPEHRDFHLDMVRPGIVLYGGKAGPSEEAWQDLMPVMTVKSVIEQVSVVDKGTKVSYGGTWTADVDSVLAVVNMGYGDGLSRLLSNRGHFYHKGKRAPIRGRVCMDRCIIDVTAIPDVKAGDEVMFFGQDHGVRQNASELAELCQTIDYELFCNIHERVPRVRVD